MSTEDTVRKRGGASLIQSFTLPALGRAESDSVLQTACPSLCFSLALNRFLSMGFYTTPLNSFCNSELKTDDPLRSVSKLQSKLASRQALCLMSPEVLSRGSGHLCKQALQPQ